MYKPKDEADLSQYVLGMLAFKMTTRSIAASYGDPITCADISRISRGKYPKGEGKRLALGLPPICPVCYRRIPHPRPPVPAWVTQAADWLQEREVTKEVKC